MTSVILTGHSRGLGAAIAAELLARGVAVLGLSRGGNPALAAAYPQLLTERALDLSDSAALAGWLAGDDWRALVGDKRVPGSLLLINNAGLLQPVGPVDRQEGEAIVRAVNLNVTAPLLLTSALAAVRAGRELRVLHVSSGAARNAYAGWSVYCATKAALDQHARAVALDGGAGIRICSLAPGVIDTDMQAEIRAGSAELFPLLDRFKGLKADGNLVPPAVAAASLVDYLLSADFGSQPVADLRDLA